VRYAEGKGGGVLGPDAAIGADGSPDHSSATAGRAPPPKIRVQGKKGQERPYRARFGRSETRLGGMADRLLKEARPRARGVLRASSTL
jgi:hypothetical protein